MANRSAAADAANEYLIIEATDPAAAASFARSYEERASSEDFDAYLGFLDLAYAGAEAA